MPLGYKRYTLGALTSLAPVFTDDRRGIYVLEFTDGSSYVGRTENIVTRFYQHTHDTKHHAAWSDIERVAFAAVPSGDLAAAETSEIRRLRAAGRTLRNRAGNLGHAEPSPFDELVSVEDQQHWAAGGAAYSTDGFRERAAEETGPSKLSSATVDAAWGPVTAAVTADLAFALAALIPDAVGLEARYWTISDMPSTAGGRFATLSTGWLEFMYFPRWEDWETDALQYSWATSSVVVNLPPGIFLPEDAEVLTEYTPLEGHDVPFVVSRMPYPSGETEAVTMPAGALGDFFLANPDLVRPAREQAIAAMRQNQSGMFRRWHSRALASEAFAVGTAFGL